MNMNAFEDTESLLFDGRHGTFRTLPVMVNAQRFFCWQPLRPACVKEVVNGDPNSLAGAEVKYFVTSRQGEVEVDDGDWIIEEPGDPTLHYPCKDDVFNNKYVRVN